MAAEQSIVDVKPDTRNWTCRLTLIEKQNVRTARNSPLKFMPMILTDATGTKVQATVFGGDIQGIDQRLALYSTYLFSNAFVKPITDMRFCVDYGYPYVWSFNRRTLIRDVDAPEGLEYRQLAELGATPFHDLYASHMRSDKITILAAIVSKLPRTFVFSNGKQRLAWDVVLINEECILIPFTLWEEFVERHGVEIDRLLYAGDHPLVLINRVVVNLFQGLTFATRYDCHMELNPGGQRAHSLKRWVASNIEKINMLVRNKEYDNAFLVIAQPLSQPRTTLSCLDAELNKVPVVWVMGRFSLVNTTDEYFYAGCDYCNRKVYGSEGIAFECLFCGQTNGTIIRRFRLETSLTDTAISIPLTLFSTESLALLHYTGVNPNIDLDLDLFSTKLQEVSVVVGLKRTKVNEDGMQGHPYSVVYVAVEETNHAAPTTGASTSGVLSPIPSPPTTPAIGGNLPPITPTTSPTKTDSTCSPSSTAKEDPILEAKRKLTFKTMDDKSPGKPATLAHPPTQGDKTMDDTLVTLRTNKRKSTKY